VSRRFARQLYGLLSPAKILREETIMNRIILFSVGAVLGLLCSTLHGQVPGLINYQGRVAVGATNFNGAGQFKFALVDGAGTTTYWSNDGTSSGGSEPTNAVSITVTNGLYSVLLGDTSLANMTTTIPTQTVFNNSDVRLRVWFNDGTHGSQLLSPDQRVAAVGYAFVAASMGDNSTGAVAFTSGNQLKIQAPGGIKLQTGGSGTGITLTTSTDSPNTNNGLNINGDINSTGVVTAAAVTVGAGGLSGIDAGFSGNVSAKSFTTTSDRNAKERFRPINAREILSHLASLPIQTWNFKQGDSGAQHIGPMAQDFYAAFQVGPDDKHIATVDADGVAFAAIQGLNEIVQEQNAQLAAKAKKIDALEKRLDEIEKGLKQNTSINVK
jgi:Chaperone of endosialidase